MKRKSNGEPAEQIRAEAKTPIGILDLNNDCLRHLCIFLSLPDLVVVADVCVLLKDVTQAHFRTTKYTNLDLTDISECAEDVDSVKNGLLYISKALRIFGELVVSIRAKGIFIRNLYRAKFSSRIIMLISCFCSNGNLNELCLENFNHASSSFSAQSFRLLLKHLKKLELRHGQCTKAFLKRLAYHWPKLEALAFSNVSFSSQIVNVDVEKVLSKNPQLKKIELFYCRNVTDRILKSIATHTPQIESLKFKSFELRSNSFERNSKYLGRMNKLISLEIDCYGKSICSAIDEMAAANVAIEYLKLRSFNLRDQADRFANGVSKLKTIKSLVLSHSAGLKTNQVIDIAKNLHQLTEFELTSMVDLTEKNLLELLKSGQRLQKIKFGSFPKNKIFIGGDLFMKMVKIVEKRTEKAHLMIFLLNWYANVIIPEYLVSAHSGSLTVRIF